jgi:hypothetical protein
MLKRAPTTIPLKPTDIEELNSIQLERAKQQQQNQQTSNNPNNTNNPNNINQIQSTPLLAAKQNNKTKNQRLGLNQ